MAAHIEGSAAGLVTRGCCAGVVRRYVGAAAEGAVWGIGERYRAEGRRKKNYLKKSSV